MTRVLHVLDHSLPLHSGYTFRTRAILKAQEALGLEVRGLTSQRHNAEAEWDAPCEEYDGLTFHRTPGVSTGPMLVREFREMAATNDAIRKLAAELDVKGVEAEGAWAVTDAFTLNYNVSWMDAYDTTSLSAAREHIDHTRRKSCFFCQLSKIESTQRCFFTWLY